MKTINLKNYLLLVVFFWTSTSFAAFGINIGAHGGLSSVSSNGTSTSTFGFGGRAGIEVIPNWAVSGEFTYMSTTPSSAATGYTSNLGLTFIIIDYRFSDVLSGLYVGPKLGLGFTSAGSYTGSSIAFGGEAGYDFKLGMISVGPLLRFESVSAPTLNGVSGNSATLFSAMATVKYWL